MRALRLCAANVLSAKPLEVYRAGAHQNPGKMAEWPTHQGRLVRALLKGTPAQTVG